MRYPKPFNEREAKRFYCDEKLSVRVAARELGIREGRLTYFLKKAGLFRSRSEATKLAVEKRRLIPISGENHPGWKGGHIKTSSGYIMVRAPEHPRASVGGGSYVMEHILVWEQVHNRSLPEGWVVHHLNGVKTDNRPSNLVALPNKKHYLVLAAKAQRIRELEAEVKLLEKALADSQMIFRVNDN